MKKVISLLTAGVLALSSSVCVFAATTNSLVLDSNVLRNGDDEGKETISNGAVDIVPDVTRYLILSDNQSTGVTSDQLADDDLFKISVDKDGDGKSLIKTVTQQADKKFTLSDGSVARPGAIKIVIADSTTTSELKAKLEITLKAKKDVKDSAGTVVAAKGDEYNYTVTFWINNTSIKGADGDVDTGEGAYFDPEDNETNSLIWGDDRAALKFEANDDASKFYAKLSTKADSEIYATYGDPVNADLWFYDFVGNPTIPSTSRATLTLGIPWDDDDDYTPDPEDIFIYSIDADGFLTDVTDQFTYSEDATDIEGWSIKTRTLGTYVISDTELDLEAADDVDEAPDETDDEDGKTIPNTGSSDMVNVAVVGAIVSLAAAGAVALRKVK